jgi:hypothetical protein
MATSYVLPIDSHDFVSLNTSPETLVHNQSSCSAQKLDFASSLLLTPMLSLVVGNGVAPACFLRVCGLLSYGLWVALASSRSLRVCDLF